MKQRSGCLLFASSQSICVSAACHSRVTGSMNFLAHISVILPIRFGRLCNLRFQMCIHHFSSSLCGGHPDNLLIGPRHIQFPHRLVCRRTGDAKLLPDLLRTRSSFVCIAVFFLHAVVPFFYTGPYERFTLKRLTLYLQHAGSPVYAIFRLCSAGCRELGAYCLFLGHGPT